VKVEAFVSGNAVSGFIWEDSLANVPDGLPVLNILDVPWDPMYLDSCNSGTYDPATGAVTFSTRENETWYGNESAVWDLETPVRVVIGMMEASSPGVEGGIKLIGSRAGLVSTTQWWLGARSMVINDHDGSYTLDLFDGTSFGPATSIRLERSTSEPIQILFDQPEGRGFTVLDGTNEEIRHVDVTALPGVNLPDGLFPQREFYFGVGFSGQGSLSFIALSVGTEPDGRWTHPVEAGPGLASLTAEANVTLGTEFSAYRMIDRRYCQALQRDFDIVIVTDINYVVPDIGFWLGRNQYNFATVDRSVEIAQQRGWRVYGSHLIWGAPQAIPDWLMNSNFTRDEYVSILEEYVETVVERYRGRIDFWGIANEAVERDYYYPKPYVSGQARTSRPEGPDFWYEKIGPGYIEMAFRRAREADPDAILILNTSVSPPPIPQADMPIADQFYETAKGLIDRGVPIDGVGVQLHLLAPTWLQTPPPKASTIAYYQELGALGVKVYVTEFDVDLGSTDGTREERYAFQAQVYQDMLEACLESGVCDTFMYWGFADSLSWLVCTHPNPIYCNNEPNADPNMLDREFNPKPAYFAVSEALQGIPAMNPYTLPARPSTSELISACLALAGSAPPPGSGDPPYDDFEAAAYDGRYNGTKWQLTGSFPNPIARQQGGMLVIGTESDLVGSAAGIVARNYASFLLDRPKFFEADLALCPNPSAGDIHISLNAFGLESGGFWMSACGSDHLSSRTWGGCGDFLWVQEQQDPFASEELPSDLGAWHRMRIEIDPATMTITYSIDGEVIGSHVSAFGDVLRSSPLQFNVSMWKTSAEYPFLGLVDNVRIGQSPP